MTAVTVMAPTPVDPFLMTSGIHIFSERYDKSGSPSHLIFSQAGTLSRYDHLVSPENGSK